MIPSLWLSSCAKSSFPCLLRTAQQIFAAGFHEDMLSVPPVLGVDCMNCLPPECGRSLGECLPASGAVAVYLLGAQLYFALTGHPPSSFVKNPSDFWRRPPLEAWASIDWTHPVWSLAQDWRRFLADALAMEPSARPGFASCAKRLAKLRIPSWRGHELERLLGAGSYGAVYEVVSRAGCLYALKLSVVGKGAALQMEYKLLSSEGHPNLLKVFAYEERPGACAMLAERLPSIGYASTLCGDYRKALRHLHGHGIAHGDLRNSNLGSNSLGYGVLLDLGSALALKRHPEAAESDIEALSRLERKFSLRSCNRHSGGLHG